MIFFGQFVLGIASQAETRLLKKSLSTHHNEDVILQHLFYGEICFAGSEKNSIKLTGSGVVAELIEQSRPTPEICSSNPVIGKFNLLKAILKLHWKDENEEKAWKSYNFKNGNRDQKVHKMKAWKNDIFKIENSRNLPQLFWRQFWVNPKIAKNIREMFGNHYDNDDDDDDDRFVNVFFLRLAGHAVVISVTRR